LTVSTLIGDVAITGSLNVSTINGLTNLSVVDLSVSGDATIGGSLTVSTLIGDVAITGSLNVSTINGLTNLSVVDLSVSGDATIGGSLSVDTINAQVSNNVSISATSLVILNGGIGFRNSTGLFTTGYTLINGIAVSTIGTKTLLQTDYIAIVAWSATSGTIQMPASPLDGETHTIKIFTKNGVSGGTLVLNAGANNFNFGATTIVIPVTTDNKSYQFVWIDATGVGLTQTWMPILGYKA